MPLSTQFPGKWIGLWSNSMALNHSPDLTTLGISLWIHEGQSVCSTSAENQPSMSFGTTSHRQ